MDCWPFLELKVEVEHFAVKEWANLNSFFQQNRKVLSKQEERDVVILVFGNIVNDTLDRFRLVVFESDIYRIPVEIFWFFQCSLVMLVLIKDWILFREATLEIVSQEISHRSAIKSKHRDKITAV